MIAKIGGIDVVSGITGKSTSRVYRWMYSKERGGTGGLIPQMDAPKLMAYARSEGIELSAEEFFPADATGEAA